MEDKILGEEEVKELDRVYGWDTDELLKETGMHEITKPLTINELLEILGLTVKHDNINKIITFLCMLTAYTEESQFNVSFRAPSATGKSYIPIELAQYFPKEDIRMYAGASPTSFFHEVGNWDDEKKAIVVDLEKKILIFLDQPHDQLLQKLRPLLSHDQKELVYKITDKKERKGLRTKTVIVRGFPSVIFCTGSLKIDEQEATRNFILSPEVTQEKIREGIYLKALRKGNPLAYLETLEKNPKREWLKQRILEIKKARIKFVIIENPEKIAEKFLQKYPRLKPRHTRDIERLISLIQGWALLNLWHRAKDSNGNLFINEEDEEIGFKLFSEIAESQELGIPPYIYMFFKEVIEPLYLEINSENRENLVGLTRKQIIAKHYEVYGRTIQDWFLRQEILPALESAGLIIQEPDPNDRRRILVHVATPLSNSLYFASHANSLSEKNSEWKGGDTSIDGICEYCGKYTECVKLKERYVCKDCKTDVLFKSEKLLI